MATLDPSSITPVSGEDPFTLVPVIRRMIITQHCTPESIFIVEGLDVIPISESDDVKVIRLLLGDGVFCIQAILHNNLFGLAENKDIFVGCYVRVEDFVLRFEEPSEEEELQGKKAMVYLIVNDLETIGWNDGYVAMWNREQKGKAVERPPQQDQPLDMNEVERNRWSKRQQPQTPQKNQKHTMEDTPIKLRDMTISSPQTPKPKHQHPQIEDAEGDVVMVDIFDTYETLTFPSRKPTPKKPTPKEQTPKQETPKKERPSTPTPSAKPTEAEAMASESQQQPVALPQDWHDHQVPLKLTTLRSIPHLPYAQNWSVNVLAIIVSLSDVESSHLPPGKQRTARIADPSTSKHVHLTVFVDPEEFNPKVGSAVLLTGVKNHRFDGGSLKKYASDAKIANGKHWWFEDPWGMEWVDVKGIKDWWAEVEGHIAQGDMAIDF